MADEVKKFDRSPNFPFISLEQALGRSRQLYDQEKRGMAALAVVSGHWNYSLKSSGLVQTVGALKSYGLLEDEGRGLDRRVRLTDLALRILLDPRADSPERRELIRQAALSPGVAQAIIERFPDPPSDANLQHFLIFDLKFNPDSAKSAVKIFNENRMFSGLYESDASARMARHEDAPPEAGMDNAERVEGSAGYKPPPIPRHEGALPAASAGKTERIIGPDESDITVHFQGSPTWETYDFLEQYIKLRKAVLKRSAAGASSQTQDESAKAQGEQEGS